MVGVNPAMRKDLNVRGRNSFEAAEHTIAGASSIQFQCLQRMQSHVKCTVSCCQHTQVFYETDV